MAAQHGIPTVLTDQYGGLPFVPVKQTVDAAMAAAGKTIRERDLCSGRSAAGRDPTDWAGILGGQPGRKKRERVNRQSDTDFETPGQWHGSEQ